jgi:hypothetical protein
MATECAQCTGRFLLPLSEDTAMDCWVTFPLSSGTAEYSRSTPRDPAATVKGKVADIHRHFSRSKNIPTGPTGNLLGAPMQHDGTQEHGNAAPKLQSCIVQHLNPITLLPQMDRNAQVATKHAVAGTSKSPQPSICSSPFSFPHIKSVSNGAINTCGVARAWACSPQKGRISNPSPL